MNTLTKRITIALSIILLLNFLSNVQTFATSKIEGKSDYDHKARTEYSVNDVIAFIYQWFAAFDHQKEIDYYLKHIAEPVDMNFPDFPIKSKDDFKRWYKSVEDNIIWNSHALRNIQVSGNEKDAWKASYDVEWKAIDKENQHIEMIIHQDVELIRKGDILEIAHHKAYMKDLNHQNTHLSALMKAAGNGNAKLVKDLIDKGANIFTLDPITGTSVVHFAAQGGNVDVMKILVDNGAEAIINLQAASNSFSPLMVATWYQNPEMIKYLLSMDHINVNLKDQFGRTASQFPVPDNRKTSLHPIDQEIVNIYKEYDSKYKEYMSEKFEQDGITPKNLPEDVKAIVAHKASYKGNPEIMEMIVKHRDFDKIKDAQGPTNGYTPLHDAIWHGNTKTAKILINAGVNTSIKAWDGLTPLELAKKKGYQEIIELFTTK
ncbi:hypothetical protein DF185_04835 [Marinifilum breve]|uniref:Uncharacterized protein n=1 Tax=Marinifilum breve TaxID=2184082 RepID=A0A2V3ZZU6_9BACT|nr:ankyrin repeat domain-containing protein [Marinifilum breve]PXY01979.1 hypothetical protein DF185_04835 [Marinifilum breve]